MSTTTTPNMSLIVPVDHTEADVWGLLLNSLFDLVDAHDHTAGKGVKVPTVGLNINADLTFASGGSQYAITDLRAIDFTPQTAASVAALAGALFINSADSELYYRTTAGANVKLTSGAALNISIVGGIGGDYTTAGALVSFDDATDSYWFQQQGSPRPWARMRSGDLDIYETAASIVNRVRIQSPAALAASYALTLPAALGGSTLALQVSAAGLMSLSNTFASALTAPDLRYSTIRAQQMPGGMWIDPNATHAQLISAIGAKIGYTLAASANKILMPLPVDEGDVIDGFVCYTQKNTNAAATITARLYRTRDDTAGTESTIGAGASSNANAPGLISLTETGLAHTVAAGYQYYLVFTPSASVTPAGDQVRGVILRKSRP